MIKNLINKLQYAKEPDVKKLLFICIYCALSSLIFGSNQPEISVDYINLYKIPKDYKMYELVTLHEVIQEARSNGALPLTNEQYWGIIVNQTDIYFECLSINSGKDIIKKQGQTPMKRVVAEYILVTHLQDHTMNLDEYESP